MNKSGHTCLMKQPEKYLKITFASLSRKSYEKENEKKNWNSNSKTFCVIHKSEKTRMAIAKTFAFHASRK